MRIIECTKWICGKGQQPKKTWTAKLGIAIFCLSWYDSNPR